MLLKKILLLTSMVILMTASLTSAKRDRPPRDYSDKSVLYETYPQLSSPETDQCIQGLSNLLIWMGTNSTSRMMVLDSMHGIDDLG